MSKIIFLECTEEQFDDSIVTKKEEYSLEDIVLVRTTDQFPFKKIVETPNHGRATTKGSSYILGQEIVEAIRRKYKTVQEKSREAFIEEVHQFDVLAKNPRKTIHFAINGLVGSHELGNFEGRAFVIIEPLKHHIEDKSLLSLGACDTYFDDDMILSEDAVVLIEESIYKKIKDDEKYKPTLESMKKIYVYRGNQKEAVKQVLNELGYDAFIVNSHGYVRGLESESQAGKMWNYLERIRKEKGIKTISHFESSYNEEDHEILEEESLRGDIIYVIFIVEKAFNEKIIDEEFRNKIIDAIKKDSELGINYAEEYYDYSSTKRGYLLPLIPTLIEKIGLENIKKYTKEYNEMFIEELEKAYKQGNPKGSSVNDLMAKRIMKK